MTTGKTVRFYAWDRIQFLAPSAWRLTGLDRGHIRLDDGSGGGAEMKWGEAGRSFSVQKQVARIRRGCGKTIFSGPEEAAGALEPSMEIAAGQGWSIAPFGWKSKDGSTAGLGLVLHDPSSGKALMLQALAKGQQACLDPVLVRSLCFHQDGGYPIHIMGLSAELPQGYVIQRARLNPGHFSFLFKKAPGGRRHLALERFAPADVILRGSSLEDWAGRWRKDRGFGRESRPSRVDESLIKWAWPSSRPLLPRLIRRSSKNLGRIWLDSGGNCILAAALDRAGPAEEEDFQFICESYRHVP